MMTTKIFLYHQCHRAVLMDTSGDYFSRRYNQVYTKNLKAHRGTDNQILIEFVNQDQKRIDLRDKDIADTPTTAGAFSTTLDYKIVSIGNTDFSLSGAKGNFRVGDIFTATNSGIGTGTASLITYSDLSFTCQLISRDGSELLLTKDLEIVNRATGQTKLVLLEEELDTIAPGRIGFSIEQTSDATLYEPVFVDDTAGGRGNIDILDSIMPTFNKSAVLTVPDHTALSTNGLDTIQYPSSVLDVDDNSSLHTFQFVMHQFTGDIKVEGSVHATGPWYTVQTETLTTSDLHIFNVNGFHPYLRCVMTENTVHATGAFKIGYEYRIKDANTTDFTLIGAERNNTGTDFVATGTGNVLDDGTATPLFDTITEIRHR